MSEHLPRHAKDLGVKHDEGEFTAFIDAGCIVDRSLLNELVKHFNDEKVASVGGGIKFN